MRGYADRSGQLGRAMVGLILIAIGLSMLRPSMMMGMVLFAVGVVALFALLSRAAATRPGWTARRSPRRARAQGQEEPDGRARRVAERAMRRAGQDPADLAVRPVDVGLLVYRNGEPSVYREARLPVEAEHVRPFVVLRSPRRARGRLRFELCDSWGTRRFIDETVSELQPGENFLYAETWLPLRNVDAPDGEWELRVYGAGVLLAAHAFRWQDAGGGAFRAYLTEEGELTEELRQELARARLERLSLDELLEEQDGGLPDLEAAEKATPRDRQTTGAGRA